MWNDNFMLNGSFVSFLQEENSWKLILLMFSIVSFWILFTSILVKFIPKKYQFYKKEIFLFLVILNFGLLFMGVILTATLLLFGLYWATFRKSHLIYEVINFEQYFGKIPFVESRLHEGILNINANKQQKVKTEEMIQSLETIYNSTDQNNIGTVKQCLLSNVDEIRLIAFSQISSYEKLLTKKPKVLQNKLEKATTRKEVKKYNYLLAETYWQFIFHGVADKNLLDFYIEKIERHLQSSERNLDAFILYGRISMHKKEYKMAQKYFLKALKFNASENLVYPYLAEIEYQLKNFSAVSKYIGNDIFNIDLKMKPYHMIWSD